MSKDTEDLRQERAEGLRAAEAIIAAAKEENRGLTDEENKQVDDAMELADKQLEHIERLEKLERSVAGLDKPIQAVSPTPAAHPTQKLEQPAEARTVPRVGIPRRQLRSFYRPNRRPEISYQQAESDSVACDQWFRATFTKNQAARQWLVENAPFPVETRIMEEGAAGQQVLVPSPLEDAIIDLRESFGVARRVCRIVPMTSDTMTLPKRNTSVTMYYPAEVGTITASDAVFEPLTLTARKLAALTRVSVELVEDANISITDFLASDMAQRTEESIDDAFINGDGTSTYGGITGVKGKLDANEAFAGVYTAATNTDTYAEVAAADLSGVLAVTPVYAQANARWIVSQSGFANMFERLAVAGGGNTTSMFADGARMAYLGYPVEISQKMDTGAATDLSEACMALFGDFQQGVLYGDRRGTTMATSSDVYFTTEEIAVRATTRFDINFHGFGDATNAGPVTALMGD